MMSMASGFNADVLAVRQCPATDLLHELPPCMAYCSSVLAMSCAMDYGESSCDPNHDDSSPMGVHDIGVCAAFCQEIMLGWPLRGPGLAGSLAQFARDLASVVGRDPSAVMGEQLLLPLPGSKSVSKWA
jgi:hypothetical protein